MPDLMILKTTVYYASGDEAFGVTVWHGDDGRPTVQSHDHKMEPGIAQAYAALLQRAAGFAGSLSTPTGGTFQ